MIKLTNDVNKVWNLFAFVCFLRINIIVYFILKKTVAKKQIINQSLEIYKCFVIHVVVPDNEPTDKYFSLYIALFFN